MHGQQFSGINLSEANLSGTDISGFSFEGADFTKSNLTDAFCYFANFRHADFRKAKLSQTNFDSATLSYADFRGAEFKHTYVRGARLFHANVKIEPEMRMPTNILGMKSLYPNQFETLKGDQFTVIHPRFKRPIHWNDLSSLEETDPLVAPIIKAAPVDITFSQAGIGATPHDDQAILRAAFSLDCNDRLSALIENALSIANSKSNLGQDTRDDLSAYADHAIKNDPVNPHRLAFLAGAVLAEATDPFEADQYSKRLKFQLSQFHLQHMDFLEHCVPSVAEAVKTKEDAQLSRAVSKEEATRILDTLETSILETEAAMASMREVLRDLRQVDDKLNEFAIKVFTDREKAKLDRAVAAETKELASIGAVVYFRAKQVVQAARQHGGDLAIMATVTGKTVPEIAQTVMNALRPLMEKLAELLTVLPPL